jgi:cytochrome c peroxidase
MDFDNASVASAAVFDPYGTYLFVALETSREVAVMDAYGFWEIFRINVGRAPQGLAISPDGTRLYVNNFMDRSVGVYDISGLIARGESDMPVVTTVSAVATEALSAQVLKGKQLFYDARDTRLARDAYMSCASCHNDGGNDGRTWDLTGLGEGLRNTINLRGRAGMAQGFLHWSGNFDEVQDFEGQIRALAGGTGLMADAAYNTDTRNQPLGTTKAGVSADLDALAAYVSSLGSFENSPKRNSDGTLTAAAVAGREVFRSQNCGSCHAGTTFTSSGPANLKNIGTLKPSSGTRLGAALTGIDVPTLRDVWTTAPYLHDGSAPTLTSAVLAHTGVTVSGTNLTNLVAYLEQIGGQETSAPVATSDTVAPGLPGDFVVSQTAGRPVLTWTAATDNVGVAGYSIRRSLESTVTGPEIARTSALTFTDSTVTEGVRYYYAVCAYDAAGNVGTCTTRRSVLPKSSPTIPGNLTVVLSSNKPLLTWTASTDNTAVAGYVIYRSTTFGTGSEVARTTSLNWADTAAVAGTTYTYNVRAYDLVGNLSSMTPLVSIKSQ